jgi:hypothetical protein
MVFPVGLVHEAETPVGAEGWAWAWASPELPDWRVCAQLDAKATSEADRKQPSKTTRRRR